MTPKAPPPLSLCDGLFYQAVVSNRQTAAPPTYPCSMPRIPEATKLDGPDEGFYDPREGAKGYAPIVASFGALAVTAIVVVFSATAPGNNPENLTLTTGLLAMAVFGSFLAAFGLAAVGAEKHPTANLPAVVMFLAIPVALAFIGILGAFEVLAATFVPQSTMLFALITGAGGAVSVVFSAFVVGDSWGMHPTTIAGPQFEEWRSRQWIQNAEHAQRQSILLVLVGIVPVIIAVILRLANARIGIGLTGINVTVGVGILLILTGTAAGIFRARHPYQDNDQKGIRRWEAWASSMAISVYTAWLLLVLPI